MATELHMPKLGATMTQGQIIKWFKNEGEQVEIGEPLLEIMTDKIEMEVEANASGILLKTLYEENAEVNVNEVIAFIGEEGEEVSGSLSDKTMLQPEKTTIELHERSSLESNPQQKVRATPAARKLARELNLNLHQIAASKPKERIHRSDVKQFINETVKDKFTPLAQKVAHEHKIALSNLTGTDFNGKILRNDVLHESNHSIKEVTKESTSMKILKVEGIRKIIGQRMVQSIQTAPHVTLTTEADMTEMQTLRTQLLRFIEERSGYRLSYTELLIKAVANSLKNHPMVSASLQNDNIILNNQINIGIAVAIPNGLLVPVVKNADQKGLTELTSECKRLVKEVKNGSISPDDMNGGTFTISNLGMYAVDAFTPIINPPETAILGVGRINEKPAGVNREIKLRKMMSLSLSFDHRVIDGAVAAAFLTELKSILEEPFRLLA